MISYPEVLKEDPQEEQVRYIYNYINKDYINSNKRGKAWARKNV